MKSGPAVKSSEVKPGPGGHLWFLSPGHAGDLSVWRVLNGTHYHFAAE